MSKADEYRKMMNDTTLKCRHQEKTIGSVTYSGGLRVYDTVEMTAEQAIALARWILATYL